MPPPGAGPSWEAELPPPGDHASWSEADWNWDPVSMTATAVGADPQRKPATGSAPTTAAPVGCSAAGGAINEYLQGLMQASGSVQGTPTAEPAAGSVDADGSADGGSAGGGSSAPARGRGRGAKPRKGSTSAGAGACVCQAEGCGLDLSGHTYYHQRNRICSVHVKADAFTRDGQQLRFCQRCGHAHPLSEFDPGKHSCRKQLEKHNARRRKRQQAASEAAAGAAQQPAPQEAKRSRGKAAAPQAQHKAQHQVQLQCVVGAEVPSAAYLFPSAPGLEQQQQHYPPNDTAPVAHWAQQQPVSRGRQSLEPSTGPHSTSASQSGPDSGTYGGSPPASAGALRHEQPPPGAAAMPQGAAGSLQAAVPLGAAGSAAAASASPVLSRQASPALPFLDFDLDSVRPTPFEELFQPLGPGAAQQQGDAGAELAAELADWLNSNLAESSAQLAQQGQQQSQQACGPDAQQPQQDAWLAAASAPQLPLGTGSTAWLPQAQQPASLQYGLGILQQPVLPPAYGPAQAAMQGAVGGMLPAQYYLPQPMPAVSVPTLALGVPVSAAPMLQLGQLSPPTQHQQQQPAQLQQHPQSSPSPAGTGSYAAAPASSATLAAQGGSIGAGSGLAAAASAAAGGASPPPTLATVSVKLFGCTPAELPQGLRDHLETWFDGAVHAMDGYLRPGCVHLTVQALLDGMLTAAQQRAAAQGPDARAHQAPASEPVEPAVQPQHAEKPCCKRAAAASVAAAAPADGPPAPEQPTPPAAASVPAAAPCCGRKRAAQSQPALEGGADGAVRRVVDRMLQSGEALWRTKTMLVQAGSHVALVHQGRLMQTWDIEGAPSARAVPAILDVSPPLLLASQPEALRVSGLNLLQNDCQLLLRLQGRYVQPAAASCSDCACAAPVAPASGADPANQLAAAAAVASFEQRCCGCCVNKLQLVGLLPRVAGPADAQPAVAGVPAQPPQGAHGQAQGAEFGAAVPSSGALPACCQAQLQELQPASGAAGVPAAHSGRRLVAGAASVQSLRVQLPSQQAAAAAGLPPLLPGLLHLDVSRRAFTAPKGARVLVVSSPAVHAELVQLVRTRGPGSLQQPLLDQLGIVHEWLGQPHKMQYQLVEGTAARLLFWAVSAGLPATAGLLLSVLQAEGGTSAAAAASVLQRAVRPDLAGGAAAAALASLDGLSQLHLSMQAASGAAMQRASELACHDGLSLLHRAVQSASPATLAAVLGWGEESGVPWRCDLAGPLGLSPLHLAALLPSPGTARKAALLLMSRCAPGASAWECCCTTDGQTPAAFFRARAGDAAADGLATEVAVLQQVQERQSRPAGPRMAQRAQAAQAARVPRPPPPAAGVGFKAPPPLFQTQQTEEPSGGAAPAIAPVAVPGPAAQPPAHDMQPSTPRRNPGCLCAPGCPCALLDRCACCESSDEDDEEGGHGGSEGAPAGTCGAGSGKCCCCSGEQSIPGCAGCQGQAAPAGVAMAAGGCCGSTAQASAPRSCCGK